MAYTYQAPHQVRDKAKLAEMIKTLKNGGTLPPVVVCGEIAYTGSHRLAAWAACGIDADAVEIEDADYVAAMELLDLDPMYDDPRDYNELCDALYRVVTDDAVKTALADQRN
jgi:hypothetical protein